jgi:hypothetical protein
MADLVKQNTNLLLRIVHTNLLILALSVLFTHNFFHIFRIRRRNFLTDKAGI